MKIRYKCPRCKKKKVRYGQYNNKYSYVCVSCQWKGNFKDLKK